MVNYIADGKVRSAMSVWHEASRKCGLLIFPCFAFFLWNASDLMVLLYGPAYALAAYPFFVYLLRLPLRTAVYGSVLRALGRTRPIATATVIALAVNVVVSVALTFLARGTLLSFVGPSIGAVVASVASVAYYIWTISRLTGLPLSQAMRWRELGHIMAVSLLASAVIPLAWLVVPLEAVWARMCLNGLLYVGALAVLAFATGLLKQDERSMIRSVIEYTGLLPKNRAPLSVEAKHERV